MTKFGLYCVLSALVLTAARVPAEAKTIMVINSNPEISKYAIIDSAYMKTNPDTVRIGLKKDMEDTWLYQQIAYYNPALIHSIGAVALKKVLNLEKQKILFTSVINWERYNPGTQIYGISNEIDSRKQLFMFKFYFPNLKNIGVIYTPGVNQGWLDNTIQESREIGLQVLGYPVTGKTLEFSEALRSFIKRVDVVWFVSDPALLREEHIVLQFYQVCADLQKPVFSYDKLFVKLGATLSISVDPVTLARQAEIFSKAILAEQPIINRVQDPAGSKVILNLDQVARYNLNVNQQALGSVDELFSQDSENEREDETVMD